MASRRDTDNLRARVRELEEALDIRETENAKLRAALAPFVTAGKCLPRFEIANDVTYLYRSGQFIINAADFVRAVEAAEGAFTPAPKR